MLFSMSVNKIRLNTLSFTLPFILLQYKYYFYIVKVAWVIQLCNK